jgi:hypothetical protein
VLRPMFLPAPMMKAIGLVMVVGLGEGRGKVGVVVEDNVVSIWIVLLICLYNSFESSKLSDRRGLLDGFAGGE